mmetsp:Transcript_28675/g.52336  ORF Transcript_28675/g.52336 Transcript_28675/m.52336 type:complete len:288 (-) Transcript_28675:395-1258(-)
MEILELFSLFLFIALAIPAAILAKFRTYFPLKCHKTTVIALPYSPFCEKVFWAYDRCKVPYTVRTVFQGFFPTTLLEFSASSVPIVVHADGSVIKDSKDVLNSLYEENKRNKSWLYPSPSSIRELESNVFGDKFGGAVARIVYHHLFSSSQGGTLLKRVWKVNVSPFERLLTEPLYPALRWAMRSGMNLPGGLPDFISTVDEVFDRVSTLLEKNDGRKYICDTEDLSAADIAFASLAYPLVLPEEKADVFLSWNDELPRDFREEVGRRRESVAGQFVLRLYREERNL